MKKLRFAMDMMETMCMWLCCMCTAFCASFSDMFSVLRVNRCSAQKMRHGKIAFNRKALSELSGLFFKAGETYEELL